MGQKNTLLKYGLEKICLKHKEELTNGKSVAWKAAVLTDLGVRIPSLPNISI